MVQGKGLAGHPSMDDIILTSSLGNFPTYLLFEVPSLLLVHQHQVEVVPHAELFIDVLHGGSEVVASQEQANGNGLATNWSSVHNLVLGYLLILCVDIGSCMREGEREREREERERKKERGRGREGRESQSLS